MTGAKLITPQSIRFVRNRGDARIQIASDNGRKKPANTMDLRAFWMFYQS